MTADDRAMALFAERAIDELLELDPVQASYLGYTKWSGLWPDYSPSGIAQALDAIDALEQTLKTIDRSQLSLSWAIDHELLALKLEETRFLLRDLAPHLFDVQLYNSVIGGGFYHLTVPPTDEKAWPDRLRAILSRLERLPVLVEQAKANLKTPPKIFTEFVIARNRDQVSVLEETLPSLFAPYPELLARFEDAKPIAVRAILDFQDFLEKDLLSRSTGDWRLGPDLFRAKLRYTLHSDLEPDQIYREAEERLSATRLEMLEVALPIFRKTWPDDRTPDSLTGDELINYVVGKVVDEASKEHGTPESFFSDVTNTAEEIKAFIRQTNLVTLPPADDNFVIEPTPPFLDGLAVAFYNPAPAFEPNAKKSYWISTVPKAGTADAESYLREYNRYQLQALTIHEAFPGHYVQLYWSSHSPHTSLVKQVLESGTMTEGWACMIEQIMHEAGFSKDSPKSLLFHLKMRLRIFLNAMIDVRLHKKSEEAEVAEKWALELLQTKGFQEEAEASRKLQRAKLTSTQLSTYFVGYREMLAIYRDAEKRLGASFDRREFLEQMISFGSIPPQLIRNLIEQPPSKRSADSVSMKTP